MKKVPIICCYQFFEKFATNYLLNIKIKVAVVNKFIGKSISAFIVAKFAKLRTSKILDYKIKTAKNRMEFCACSLLYKIQTCFKGFETPKFYVFYQTAFKLPVKIQVSRKCVFKKH